jgi:putative transposase
VEPNYAQLSLRRQCALLGISRASLYYEPVEESQENLALMRLIDRQYTRVPFYGSRRMTAWLQGHGHAVNRKRVVRLMRQMGIEAVYAKPKLSRPGEGHKIYPYLLKEMKIERKNQVWCTDITYAAAGVSLPGGGDGLVQSICAELEVVVDDGIGVLPGGARARVARHPEIFNSDQGSQFTSEKFVDELERRNIAISMDGRGRCMDNIFIERLWRSLKYEEVYLKDYQLVSEARAGIDSYFQFYNHQRLHQSLDYRTPAAIYQG